jgi:phosphate-selective porin OprO/OprP
MRPDRIVIAIAAAAMLLAGRPAAAQAPQAAHPQSLEELAARLRQLQTDLATLTGNAGTPAGTATDGNAGTATSIEALRGELDELDQRIRVLGRQIEIDKEAAVEKAKTTPVVVASPEGFQLKSADNNFQLRLRGYVQSDGRFYPGDDGPIVADEFLLRRVRPLLEGTLFKFVDFRLMPDFGGGTTVLQDAYLDLKFSPAFKLRTGKFKSPLGLERLASALDIPFVERAYPTSIVANRDIGVLLFGDVAKTTVAYALGVVNGATDGSSLDVDDRDAKDVVARVFVQPFKNGDNEGLKQLGFGIAGSNGTQRGTILTPNLPTIRTSGQQIFFRYRTDATPEGTTFADGAHWRVVPQAYYYNGPLGLLTEYVAASQAVRRDQQTARIGSSAWQLTGTWVLTGEKGSYRGVAPTHPFDTKSGALGAFELTARYHVLEIDDNAFPVFANPTAAARSAKAWAAGVNWYLNRAVKIQADYEQTHFEGGATTGDRKTANEILTRFQVGF